MVSDFLNLLNDSVKSSTYYRQCYWIGNDDLFIEVILKSGVRKQITFNCVTDKLTKDFTGTLDEMITRILG